MKHVSREASRLRRAQRELEYRRINWRACAQQQIRRAFQGLVATARAEQYPIKLTLGEYDEPNEEAVLIEARPHPTGVVNRKTKFNFETLEREHEHGSSGDRRWTYRSPDGRWVYFLYSLPPNVRSNFGHSSRSFSICSG